ncbi:CENP-B N-terminal DNA-binding domain [Popillia japonica]|uniref:CENP-B N-terminal DNA-binding domain n=1 Tax=Popillia japonica TaxID=7064 RepID=A0AAW1L6M2_POPJA
MVATPCTMSVNRKAEEAIGSSKKKRKVITLEEKLAIIAKHETGDTNAKIGRNLKMNESTIGHIIQHADQYKKQGKGASTSTAFQTTRNRTIFVIEMEGLLLVWIDDCNQKRISISLMAIKAKAISLFGCLKEKEENQEKEETCFASSG